MVKVSGLIFSADPIKDTVATAKHLLEFTDEVVIIYSKSYKDYKSFITRNKDRRIRVFYALRLGYPEPFRHYGISLCRYDHIAMLDVDERFSNTVAAKALLDSGKADIYRLQRHEITPGSKESRLYTKQYRLFRKGSLEWKGLLHETPKIKGKVKDIRIEELHIIHDTGKPKKWDYNKLNDVFPVERPIKMAIRDAYVDRGFRQLTITQTLSLFTERYKKYKSNEESISSVNKEIIHHLRKEGIINYLNLDSKKTVEDINANYKHSRLDGITLLIDLLYKKNKESI